MIRNGNFFLIFKVVLAFATYVKISSSSVGEITVKNDNAAVEY